MNSSSTNDKPKKSPADSLAEFFEAMAAGGWVVIHWEADLQQDWHHIGALHPPLPGLANGVLTVRLAPKPKVKPLARKLRRYDVRAVRAKKFADAAIAAKAASYRWAADDAEDYGYCEQRNDYHD